MKNQKRIAYEFSNIMTLTKCFPNAMYRKKKG